LNVSNYQKANLSEKSFFKLCQDFLIIPIKISNSKLNEIFQSILTNTQNILKIFQLITSSIKDFENLNTNLEFTIRDFSNKGTDFWLGYGYHVNMAGNPAGGGTQDMVLYFTSDKNAKVTVDIPGLTVPYSQTYTVLANQVTTSNPIPKTGTQDARISGIGTYNSGIHITSDVPVVAYAHIYNASVSGASLLFPTATLGKDYYSVNYTQSSNAASANSFVFVVATEDATSVEITPSAANLNGLAVALPAVIKLNKGQIYSVMGTTNGTVGTDLTGTRIRSISNNSTGGCKKIAVFSGSGKISIGGTAGGSADNLFAIFLSLYG
jgi:hypothetical protein